jgi:DNA polymerase-4
MNRVIMHIDMDAFFASVEQKDNPDLQGKPVIVGADPKQGKGRGVVSAASYEARKYGIHSAMPISKAYRLCPKGFFMPPRGRRYMQISRKIMNIFHQYSPLVEAISLDEAFLDLTGTKRLLGKPENIGREIKDAIQNQEKLTASVGIGPNKLIAKIASDMEKPEGFVIVEPNQTIDFLKPLPVRAIWGIGRESEKKFREMGIQTVGQLASLSKETMSMVFGNMGESYLERARGIDENPVISLREVKSISNEHTFEKDETDLDKLLELLLRLSEKVGYRLRKRHLMGKTVFIKIRFSDFSSRIRHATLSVPVFNSEEIYVEARTLFLNHTIPSHAVRLLGVGITHLFPQSESQGDLFNEISLKRTSATRAVDQLKNKYGEKIIGRGKYVMKNNR